MPKLIVPDYVIDTKELVGIGGVALLTTTKSGLKYSGKFGDMQSEIEAKIAVYASSSGEDSVGLWAQAER